jgi:hypothetical protein
MNPRASTVAAAYGILILAGCFSLTQPEPMRVAGANRDITPERLGPFRPGRLESNPVRAWRLCRADADAMPAG